jgi:hypothetical protein
MLALRRLILIRLTVLAGGEGSQLIDNTFIYTFILRLLHRQYAMCIYTTSTELSKNLKVMYLYCHEFRVVTNNNGF